MTQWAAVMTNRSAISAPPQKNTPSRATATCHVYSPTLASSPPTILRLLWPSKSRKSLRRRRRRATCHFSSRCRCRPIDWSSQRLGSDDGSTALSPLSSFGDPVNDTPQSGDSKTSACSFLKKNRRKRKKYLLSACTGPDPKVTKKLNFKNNLFNKS